MKGLRNILDDSVRGAGGQRRAEEQGCLEIWTGIVGEEIGVATRAERLRDGILFVATRSSVWAYELTFMKEEIIRLLNERIGRPLVRDIRFKVGTVTAPASPAVVVRESSPAELPPPPVEAVLTERSRAQVEKAVSAIKDERIRDRTRQVLVREAHLREQKQQSGWKECPRCGALHPESHRLCPLCRLHIRT